MDNLVNWLPGVTNLFDLMHAIFLGTLVYFCSLVLLTAPPGIIKHLFREILQKNGMIDNEATKKLEDFLSRLIWPVSVSRMPPSVSVESVGEKFLSQHFQIARGSGSIKADQWRSLITVLFVGLFFCMAG
jgi:hypothetical protein